MPVLHDRVTQCSGSLTLRATSTNDVPPFETKELWIAHDHMQCINDMHLFLPETD